MKKYYKNIEQNNMTPSAAGKGDDPRPVKVSKYVANYDKIKWSKTPRKPTKNVKGKLVFVY
jgi:hypothetical protein